MQTTLTLKLNLINQWSNLTYTLLIGVPIRKDFTMKIATVIAKTARIKSDGRITGIHDAVSTNLILGAHDDF